MNILKSLNIKQRKTIEQALLVVLGGSQLPYIGPTILEWLGKVIYGPITAGVLVGLFAIYMVYLIAKGVI